MDRKIAEQIAAFANAHIDQLIASLDAVQEKVSPEEFAVYKRGVARIVAAYDKEIIDLVAREYPDLKPADDDADGPPPESPPPRSSRN